MPNISILIPYYNDEKFLKKSIESVLDQSYKDFELVLINHACTDSSRSIARSFDDSRIVHVDLEVNNGAGGGIIFKKFREVARGQYLKLFCADDIMKTNCLEVLYAFMKSNPKLDLVFADEELINSVGEPLNILWSEKFRDFSCRDTNYDLLKKYFHKKSFLPLSTCMMKNSVANNIIADNTLINEFDQTLWIQSLINGKNFGFAKGVLCFYRIHDEQMSCDNGLNRISQYDFYESIIRAKLFFAIRTYSQLKCVLGNYRLVGLVSENDSDLFPFIIACYYMENHEDLSCKVAGYEYVHDCFENEVFIARVKECLGLTISDFRKLYKKLLNPSKITQRLLFEQVGIKKTFYELVKKCFEKIFPSKKKMM
ncbi:MAG: glycosyltransferase family 2 protein [Clostridiales bacterium]|nr:glycosyltransferase family 2 protein [Clostridiales bacterium]